MKTIYEFLMAVVFMGASMLGLALILLSAGCQNIKPTMDNEKIVINWPRENRTPEAIQKNCDHFQGYITNGCTYGHYEPDHFECTIYAQDFTSLDSPQAATFFHEVTHCTKGRFHEPPMGAKL